MKRYMGATMADSNKKKEPTPTVSKAGATLGDTNASGIQRTLASAALRSAGGQKPSAEVAAKAAKVLQSDWAAEKTRSLAASVLAQSGADDSKKKGGKK